MSRLLQEQIEDLETEFRVLSSSSENKVVIDEYELILKVLEPVRNELVKHCSNRMVLGMLPENDQVLGLTAEEKEQLQKAQVLFSEFSDSWNELDYRVRQGDLLDNLKQCTEKLNSLLSGTNSPVWTNYVGNLIASVQITEAQLDFCSTIPTLERNVVSFREKYIELTQLTKGMPSEKEAKERLDDISSLQTSLSALAELLVLEDLPEEVKRFFEYINRLHECPLDAITPAVIKWLKDNNELKGFVVKRTFR